MENLPYAMILSVGATRRISHSALPDAPVVPEPARRHEVGVRPRAALARGLRAAAALVAPEPAAAGSRDAALPAAVAARRGGTCVPTT